MDISDLQISDQPLTKENYRDSKTSNQIDMKLGPVTKFDKKNVETSENMTMTSCWKILMSLSFYQFMANLEKSGNLIPGAWSVKLTFSLTVTFYLTKNEKRTKESLTQFWYYYLE